MICCRIFGWLGGLEWGFLDLMRIDLEDQERMEMRGL